MLLYTPLLYPNESLMHDFALREQCCDGPGLCDLFFTRRPSQECTQYDPMTWGKGYKITYKFMCYNVCVLFYIAWGFGDPHFRNIDGTVFTFNGQGEYTMLSVEETGFVLQGRTEPVMSGDNQATRFTAFAFGIRDKDIVVEVRNDCITQSLLHETVVKGLWMYHQGLSSSLL